MKSQALEFTSLRWTLSGGAALLATTDAMDNYLRGVIIMSHYDDLQYRLQELAIEITQNFCSQCPGVLKDVFCPMTGLDEFVRRMKGVGAYYNACDIEAMIDALS